MGEFDVAVLMDQYVGKAVSKKIYPEWRGGYYYAAKPKLDANAPLGLLYVSRWSGPEAAERFAGIYAQSLKQRYKQAQEVSHPDSRQPDAAVGADGDPQPARLKGRHEWKTEEGTIVIEQQGDTVFVSESLDQATTATLEKEALGK